MYRLIHPSKVTDAVATFIQSLAPLNSAANPIIYCLFSTNAGQNLCSLFCFRKPNAARAGRNGRILASHNTAQTTKSTTLDSTASSGHQKVRAANSRNHVAYAAVPTSADKAKKADSVPNPWSTSVQINRHNSGPEK